ncbi:MAG: dihydrodipicolinate synthase family protein [Victivallaceae bacterium]|nr:dihydrodipicolinate synthase family protein [Victivallaceae bacterium]
MIPNLAGIKFNCQNLYDYQNCLDVCAGKYDIVFGVDEFFASALAAGAKAFIGSTYNYSAKLYHAIKTAFDSGNREETLRLMRKVCRGVDLLEEYGGIPAGKAMMLLHGIDCGPARLPLRQLDRDTRQKIAGCMGKILND